ncbi:hypothetical protein POTOM_020991 [Populus tomentosa]|uniref:Transmembrane protein n=1 Tax=Populus tomentosa TaxID=118781 RepID=A0A8X7ZLP2_POPTO|nr:hypothetical protein POTOM_020991 [Populus tomentosa]
MDSKKVSLVLIVSFLFMVTISPCAFSMREIPLTYDGVDGIATGNTKNIPLSNVMMPKSADKCLPPVELKKLAINEMVVREGWNKTEK